jgi:hypothetical protein
MLVIALRAKTTSESELLDGRAAFIEARIIHDERLSVQMGDGRSAMASAVVPLGDDLTVDGA